MTYKQFLVALKKVRTMGQPTSDYHGCGTIRVTGMPGVGGRCCPIEAVAVVQTGHTYSFLSDDKRLKLSSAVATRIIDAADQARGYSKTVRRDLLKALGLKEVKAATAK